MKHFDNTCSSDYSTHKPAKPSTSLHKFALRSRHRRPQPPPAPPQPSPTVDTNLLRAGGYPTTASAMTSLLRLAVEKAACTSVLAFAPELFDEMPCALVMSKNVVTWCTELLFPGSGYQAFNKFDDPPKKRQRCRK
nr:uncharacterized protein LOC120974952 isoform X2 [Aegilops tauschii subsp. strangulata]